jgi:Fe-S cluster biogenesis protein NfuA|tara:strand:+ start:660 stop:893 length:234 start_codon:yes stop_codon:yes gene_type:complete
MDTLRTEIDAVLESIRPAIQADGGDVEFVSFDKESGVVQLRLLGACESCPISMRTLKEGIEKRMRQRVAAVTEVQAV